MYETLHEPDDDRVQEDGLNVPPPFPSLHDTELVGVVGKLELSETVAVTFTDPPGGTAAGFDVIDTVVV